MAGVWRKILGRAKAHTALEISHLWGVFAAKLDKNCFQTLFERKLKEFDTSHILGVFAAKPDKNRFQTLFGRKLIEFDISRILGVFAAKPDKNRFQTLFGRKFIEFEISPSLGVFAAKPDKNHFQTLFRRKLIEFEISHILGVFAAKPDKSRFETLFGRKLFEVFVAPLNIDGGFAALFGQQKRRLFSSSSIKLVSGKQPIGTFSIILHWPPTHGVNVHDFLIHAICPKVTSITRRKANFILGNTLIADLEIYWPDLEFYGVYGRYMSFWFYQWSKHGHYSGMVPTDFFQGAVNLMRSLPPLGLVPNVLTNPVEILSHLHGVLNVGCGLSAFGVRGYISLDEARYYSLPVVHQLYLATDTTFNLINTWNSLSAGLTQSETIILPKNVLCPYKSPDGQIRIVLVPGQPNHRVHVLQQYMMQKMREKFYMVNKRVPYAILENEQSKEKMGVLVHSVQLKFNKNMRTFTDFVTNVAPKCQRFLVVVTDMDHVRWDEHSYNLVTNSITAAMQAIMPPTMPSIICVPVSSTSNITRNVEASICKWKKKPVKCLFAVLDNFESPDKNAKNDLRMCVHGTHYDLVIGEVKSGVIRKGDTLLVMPSKVHVKVDGIYSGTIPHPLPKSIPQPSSPKSSAGVGEFVLVDIGDDVEHVSEGSIISSIKDCVPLVSEFEAEIYLLQDLIYDERICVGYKSILHIHFAVVECEIVLILQEFDPLTREALGTVPVYADKEMALVKCQIKTALEIPLEMFSDYPALGRFLLVSRDDARTPVAAGKVMRT